MHDKLRLPPVEILMVDDNPADIRLVREGLKEVGVANHLHAVADGGAALDLLHGRGEHGRASRPDIILLDLNLPGIAGHTVLAHIKGDPVLRTIPIIVLTSSEAESDVLRSYEAHANCFISKPMGFDGFLNVVRAIEDFWFSVVRLPGAA